MCEIMVIIDAELSRRGLMAMGGFLLCLRVACEHNHVRHSRASLTDPVGKMGSL